MSSFKDLIVWKKSVDLSQRIYQATDTFPKSEIYGLTSQIRRASVTIPSNIAEGQKRGHAQEFIQFLRIAYSSGAELETQLVIANRIGYLNTITYNNLNADLEEIMKMLNRLIHRLNTHPQLKTKNQKL